jgi:hypothetical protein
MDIRPTDLPITLPREVDVVRRVDAASDRQGRRQPEGREAEGEPHRDEEAPHDLVDVSAQYESAPRDDAEAGGGIPVEPRGEADSPVPHLDITA